MTMKQILALGAPPLPDGHFYRVGRVPMNDGTYVSIMRERRFFPKRLMSAHIQTWSPEHGEIDVDDAVRTAAMDAHKEFTRPRNLAYWIGDHK